MDEQLLKRYLEYADSDAALAVLFVKKHLAEARGHWVDISSRQRYEKSPNKLHFRYVVGGLYKRKIQPQYPPKSTCTINGVFDEVGYYLMVRAITWETAHRDIEQQQARNVAARKFKITGISYEERLSKKNFFREDAPPEIKTLASNLHDRTNPLWDKALKYINTPRRSYRIKKIYIDRNDL